MKHCDSCDDLMRKLRVTTARAEDAEADRDAQVREAFDRGYCDGLHDQMLNPSIIGFDLRDERRAAYLAAFQARPSSAGTGTAEKEQP